MLLNQLVGQPQEVPPKKEAVAGAVNPQLKPRPAQASAALHAKDKSQMQGVGPRPSMTDPKRDPFQPLGQQDPLKKEASKSETLGKKEKFIKANKEKFKQRYGARGLEVLYATAAEKFGKD